MLSAPQIAGLLPARVESSQKQTNDFLPPFIFDRPALADLPAAQRIGLFEATEVLLEIALGFMLGGLNEEALRAAEVVFHRAAGGQSVIRPLGPQAFNAECDADWLEMLARAKRARPMTPTEADSIVRHARAQYKDGKRVKGGAA
jgi:hypothetical protein